MREKKAKKKERKERRIEDVRKVKRKLLSKVIVKIGLERIDTQEEITIEVLLDSGVTRLVMSLEFIKKQDFKLKNINKPIYIRNMNGMFNKKEPIENTMEIDIYY